MSWIIVRSNGKVVQAWDNNPCAWSSFLNGYVRDVDWQNVEMLKYMKPKEFVSKGEATWYLDKRSATLRKRGKLSQDAEWEYAVKEYEDVVHQQKEEE